jgi:hypothetical protein
MARLGPPLAKRSISAWLSAQSELELNNGPSIANLRAAKCVLSPERASQVKCAAYCSAGSVSTVCVAFDAVRYGIPFRGELRP